MKLAESGTCEICGGDKAAVYCDGCGKKLCTGCRHFDIWCFGCGHGTAKAFCTSCYNDPSINLWLPD